MSTDAINSYTKIRLLLIQHVHNWNIKSRHNLPLIPSICIDLYHNLGRCWTRVAVLRLFMISSAKNVRNCFPLTGSFNLWNESKLDELISNSYETNSSFPRTTVLTTPSYNLRCESGHGHKRQWTLVFRNDTYFSSKYDDKYVPALL